MKISNSNSRLTPLVLWMFLILFAVTAPPCFSKEKQGKAADKSGDAPLHVTSDRMIAQKDGAMVEFIGNVRATRQEDVILAQSVKIYLYEDRETEAGTRDNVKKIVAAGEVKYTAGDRKAFADRAVYTTKDEILVLTGKSARLLTGTSWISGNKITFFRKTGRATVESDGKNRVEAFFNPEDRPDTHND